MNGGLRVRVALNDVRVSESEEEPWANDGQGGSVCVCVCAGSQGPMELDNGGC